jgi:hypothetical protein
MTTPPSKRGFLIMPFDTKFDWLRDDILAAGQSLNIAIERADDIFAPGVLLDQVLDAIDQAAVVVGICTGRNANVFFELGYAWRSHSPILLAETTADLPFDVAHYRTLIYGTPTPALDRENLRTSVARMMEAAMAARPLPRGSRLQSAPTVKPVTRLSADLQETGRHSYRLVITNTGTVDIHDVDVTVPPEVQSFRLHADSLPVAVLRPGERVRQLASVSMGGGPSVFDIELTGRTPDGEAVTFPAKISI